MSQQHLEQRTPAINLVQVADRAEIGAFMGIGPADDIGLARLFHLAQLAAGEFDQQGVAGEIVVGLRFADACLGGDALHVGAVDAEARDDRLG